MADYDSAFVWLGLGGLPRLLRLLSAFLAALLCSLLQSRMNSFIFVEEIVLFHVDAAILVEMLLFLLVIVRLLNYDVLNVVILVDIGLHLLGGGTLFLRK